MILNEIAQKTRERVLAAQQVVSLTDVKRQAEAVAQKELKNNGRFLFPFEKALKGSEISFICEVKKASPSKGIIAQDFPYLEIAKEYQSAGAAAISVLTEPYYFKGSLNYLKEISSSVSIPVLRKDFTVSPYMIYEAKIYGASAVLLICALLTAEELKEYLSIARSLGLSAIAEAHTAQEVKTALSCGAKIVGVNNRDLQTFTVDISTSIKLRPLVPQDVIYISESGIKTAQDVNDLRLCGVNGVLIGETLMRSTDKKEALNRLKGMV
ncbi:MAG: indole-3-glycerol phosphate synthase TrpC [Clostridia bacterium]|nr:indole-3-glycerol phosphate synthase TrpC [Clostridia bacterium]